MLPQIGLQLTGQSASDPQGQATRIVGERWTTVDSKIRYE